MSMRITSKGEQKAWKVARHAASILCIETPGKDSCGHLGITSDLAGT